MKHLNEKTTDKHSPMETGAGVHLLVLNNTRLGKTKLGALLRPDALVCDENSREGSDSSPVAAQNASHEVFSVAPLGQSAKYNPFGQLRDMLDEK